MTRGLNKLVRLARKVAGLLTNDIKGHKRITDHITVYNIDNCTIQSVYFNVRAEDESERVVKISLYSNRMQSPIDYTEKEIIELHNKCRIEFEEWKKTL